VVDLLAQAGAQPGAGAPVPGGASAAPAGGPNGARGAYVVLEGDSLWRIAKRQYGDGSRWKEIYDANRDVLASPDALSAGQSLRIP
jgi:nucleoid-associated protein YgaU